MLVGCSKRSARVGGTHFCASIWGSYQILWITDVLSWREATSANESESGSPPVGPEAPHSAGLVPLPGHRGCERSDWRRLHWSGATSVHRAAVRGNREAKRADGCPRAPPAPG